MQNEATVALKAGSRVVVVAHPQLWKGVTPGDAGTVNYVSTVCGTLSVNYRPDGARKGVSHTLPAAFLSVV
jgi:hypothetical protein